MNTTAMTIYHEDGAAILEFEAAEGVAVDQNCLRILNGDKVYLVPFTSFEYMVMDATEEGAE